MPSGRSTPVKAAISRKPGAAQNRATYDCQTSRVFARFAGHVIYYTVRCGVDLCGAMPRQDSLLENGCRSDQNMDWAAREFGFKWEDPADELKQSLVSDLAACAQSFGMTLTVCSQEKFVGGAVGEAKCIDTARLSAVAGAPVRAPQKGNRPECACFEARDIGQYDTCPHGCVYCYAVRNRPLAQRRYVPARSRRPVSLSAAQSARQRIQP